MAASQRRKGCRGELEAAHFLSPIFPDARRRSCGEESQTAQGRDLSGTWPFCVQVKTTAAPNPLAALAEAASAATATEIPCAYVRRVRRGVPAGEQPAIIFRASDARLLIAVYERFRASFPKRVDELRAELDGEA